MNNNNNNNIHTPLSNRSDGTDSGSMISSMYSSHSMPLAASCSSYPASRSFPQQTLTPMTPDLDLSGSNVTHFTGNPSSVQQGDQHQQIIQHLTLLLHAHKCLQRERQLATAAAAACNGDSHGAMAPHPCTVPHCATMRAVLQHMTKCSDFKNCTFNHCVQSRHIILHWKNCTSATCILCGTLRKTTVLRATNSSNKDWQQQLHRDHRSHLVKKIVSTVLETYHDENRNLQPDQQAAITSFAQQTEAETFNTATSHEDYFQRLAERIYKIQKDFEDKQLLKRQQQQQQQHSTLTTTLASIDRSAGDQGPPNRTAPVSDYSTSFSTTLLTHIKSEPSLPPDQHRLPVHSNSISAHSDVNGSHISTKHVKTEQISPNRSTSALVKKEDKPVAHEPSTSTSSDMVKVEKSDPETAPSKRAASIDASSKLLPKCPAVFSPDDIRQKMTPILHRLYNHEEGIWFRQPVTEAIAHGYFDIIKYPMDFSTISKKLDENQYTTPFQFCEDIWLVFNNTWTFNKKSQRVYKAGAKLADIFMDSVDSILKDYGYCCGRQYVFLPSAMFCYGTGGICCTIARDGDYFVYNNPDSSRNNLSGDKYTFCKKCFDSVKSEYILVGDDPAQTLAELPKAEFHQAKNDHQEHEPMVDCIVCARRFHNICVLYHDHIWPEGYVCKTCVQQHNIRRKDNRYLALKLTITDVASVLEKRVNDFLRKDCDPDTGRVTIRVLAANDRICEVKPRLKKHFGAQIPDGYPYRTKAIFAFQEIDGVDVVLFGMHVQEYDGRSPAPNARRVYISYLDSVHYFRPKQKRTALYYEILIGYLEYVKQLGFIYAHIWACPPSEGDDYIFHCHPPEQRVPKPKRLQEWYKTMLDEAVNQRVVVDYKDIMKDCTDSAVTKATDIPYFEGDFWSSTIEDLLKELDIEEEDRRKYEELEAVKVSDDGCFDDSIEPDEPSEISDKRKSGGGTTHKKKNFKKTTSQRRVARKNMTNGNDLITKIYAMMEKHKESFFVVRLRNPMSTPATLTDTDPSIQCDLMESRDVFLNFAREKHCEFSSLRRAKYSTMISLIELHSFTADKISYTCNACRQACDVRFHCTVCDDYDLCSKCNGTNKHGHPMVSTDDAHETANSSDTPVNTQQQRQLTMQRMLDAIRHAVQCRNANCLSKNCTQCKLLLKHAKECTKASRNQCAFCNKLIAPIWFHAKTCTDQNCVLPYCASFKHKLQRQRAATAQSDRRRIKAMHRAKMAPGPSPLSSQNSESTVATAGKYHQPMDSSSPSASDKMMPSGGKNGKPSLTNGLLRSNLSQPPSSQQSHPVYFNGGKGNPSNSSPGGYGMMMSQPQQPWMQPQQPMRYPSSHGNKPMAYNQQQQQQQQQQRMPYSNEPYMMRQPGVQMASNAYPYAANQGYPHGQPMDNTSMGMPRPNNPMLSPQVGPVRHPYYGHTTPMPYQQPHRSLSQNATANYSPASAPFDGSGSQSNLIDSHEFKTEEPFDDPSKMSSTQQQQQQQQQMFHSLVQPRSRPQTSPFYSSMQPNPTSYYSPQRPMTPSTEYSMSVARGSPMRASSAVPPAPYGTMPMQQRVRTPLASSLSSSGNDLTASMTNNNNNNNNITMGLHPSPSSVAPR